MTVKKPRAKDPVSRVEALGLALCLVDFELESPQIDNTVSWQNDLKHTRAVLSGLLAELHPGPPAADHPLKSNFGNVGEGFGSL